jgi:hypothetical protein
MDDFSKRLGAIEVGVAEIRAQLPHLATKADLQGVRVETGSLRSDMNAMETRLATKIEAMGTQIVSVENRIMKWMIATLLSGMALAAAIASAISHFVR